MDAVGYATKIIDFFAIKKNLETIKTEQTKLALCILMIVTNKHIDKVPSSEMLMNRILKSRINRRKIRTIIENL